MRITFLWGEHNTPLRYVPHVCVCTDGEVGKGCDVRALPNTDGEYDKELLTFRVRAGDEVTVTPSALLQKGIQKLSQATIATET